MRLQLAVLGRRPLPSVRTVRRGQWARDRLRKYARKRHRAADPLGLLYWRYWHRVHGGHQPLWDALD